MSSVTLRVNGQSHTVDTDPDMPLLWALRDLLGLTGTKYGCGVGTCGSCTVHVDGVAERSCLLAVADVADQPITTIEGLSATGDHPLQKAWVFHDVAQCGFCQAGQIMAAAALLASTSQPTDTQMDDAMHSLVCRCGTYQRIRDAIRAATGGGVT